MKTIEIELSPELDSELQSLGFGTEADLSRWIAEAIQQQLSALKQSRYFEERAARGSREKFDAVLSKVPAVEPLEEDQH